MTPGTGKKNLLSKVVLTSGTQMHVCVHTHTNGKSKFQVLFSLNTGNMGGYSSRGLRYDSQNLYGTLSNSSPRRPDNFHLPLWAPGVQVVCRHTFRQNIHIHNFFNAGNKLEFCFSRNTLLLLEMFRKIINAENTVLFLVYPLRQK